MEVHQSGPKGHMNIWGYLDETGSLGSNQKGIFGMGLLVTPSPRLLHKSISDLRSDRHYSDEFKFSNVRSKNLPLYKRLLDAYFEAVNARFSCRMYLREHLDTDLRKAGQVYKLYNRISARLIVSSLDKGKYSGSDYIAIIADDISSHIDDNFESETRDFIKMKTRRNALFGMSRAESHAFAELQMCDVLLGAVAYSFKLKYGLLETPPSKAKLELLKYLQRHLNTVSLAENFTANRKFGQRFEVVDKTQRSKK